MNGHGARRQYKGSEQIFHSQYGWIGTKEFFDLINDYDNNEQASVPIEADYLTRQSGESMESFHNKVRKNHDFIDRGDDYE